MGVSVDSACAGLQALVCPGRLSPVRGRWCPNSLAKASKAAGSLLGQPELCKPNLRFHHRQLASVGINPPVPERWVTASPHVPCLPQRFEIPARSGIAASNTQSKPCFISQCIFNTRASSPGAR